MVDEGVTNDLAPWLRTDTRATGRIGDAMFIAFHRGPLPAQPLSLGTHGAPTAAAVQVADVQEITDGAWLDGWRRGALRRLAEADLDAATVGAIDAADRCHLVRATVADPADHLHLQGAWALARWLVARGAVAVLDVFALRWHPAAALAAHDVAAPLDVRREVTIVAETTAAAGAPYRVVHSRGLRKVARPDVVTLLDGGAGAAEVDVATAALGELATRLVDGWLPAADDELEVAARRATFAPAPTPLVEALGLQNDALLVVLAPPRA